MLFFKNNSTAQLVLHAIKKGSLQDMAFMIKRLRSLLGDQTFLEAYERTGTYHVHTAQSLGSSESSDPIFLDADSNDPPQAGYST